MHPRLDIDEDALSYLERLIYCQLAQMCAAQPHTIQDVEAYVQKNFPTPIDTWALSDAQLLMDRAQKRRGVFIFPVDKLFTLLQKVRGVGGGEGREREEREGRRGERGKR